MEEWCKERKHQCSEGPEVEYEAKEKSQRLLDLSVSVNVAVTHQGFLWLSRSLLQDTQYKTNICFILGSQDEVKQRRCQLETQQKKLAFQLHDAQSGPLSVAAEQSN